MMTVNLLSRSLGSMAFSIPILLIIWRRPNTTLRVIEAIRQVNASSIYIACDGPRPDVEGEADKVKATRSIACKAIDWECQVSTRFSDINYGCRDGVASAISWFFQHVPEGIILEDDIVPHPEFFEYCGLCLERYRCDGRIWAISASCTSKQNAVLEKYTAAPLHLRYNFSCWGWATWRDRWSRYSPVIDEDWLNVNRYSVFSFCGHHSGQEVLRRAMLGSSMKADTWDYQVNAIAASQLQFTIHPSISLIRNIGFGADATHTFGNLDPSYFHEAESMRSRNAWIITLKRFLSDPSYLPPFIREVSDLPYSKPPFYRRAASRARKFLSLLRF